MTLSYVLLLQAEGAQAQFGAMHNVIAQSPKKANTKSTLTSNSPKRAKTPSKTKKVGNDDKIDVATDEEDVGQVVSQKPKPDKNAKAKDGPKKPRTAYNFFCFERTPQLRAQYPDLSFNEIGKLLGDEWKKMINSERAKYQEMAKEDKIRYEKEVNHVSGS